jgi:glycosyltransferase involved in cell wall biosynthesis
VSEAPTVSVVMGVRNGGAYLDEAVASILGQTLASLELIVVDDDSSDETPDVLAGHRDPRLRTLRNEQNLGLTRSLNSAIAVARGRFIARQDADDRSMPERLERQVRFLTEHGEIALCGTWVRFIDAEGRFVGTGKPATSPEELARLLPRRPAEAQPYHGSIVARRELMEELGGYREAFRYAQDYDLYLRAIGVYALANLPEELYELRFHRSTVSIRSQELQERHATLARELWVERCEQGDDAIDRGVPVEDLLRRTVVEPAGRRTWSDRAVRRGLDGDLSGYREALLRLIRLDPSDPRPYLRLALSLGGARVVRGAERRRRQMKFRDDAARR